MNDRKRALLLTVLSVMAGWFDQGPLLAACGCSNLTLKHEGVTDIMCSNKDFELFVDEGECLQFPGKDFGCPLNTYAYICKIGQNSENLACEKEPFQKTGFQAIATLTDGSQVEQCKTGQILQMSITNFREDPPTLDENPPINPTSVDLLQIGEKIFLVNNDNKQELPRIGATVFSGLSLYGGDNYNFNSDDTDSVLFANNAGQTPPSLSWWDNTDQTKDDQEDAANWRYSFISFVVGTNGQPTCACAFNIDVEWPKESQPRKTVYTYDEKNSENCTWPEPILASQ